MHALRMLANSLPKGKRVGLEYFVAETIPVIGGVQ